MTYYGSGAMEMNGAVNLEDAEYQVNTALQNVGYLSQPTHLEMVLMDI